jgi:hypothetical protein
MSTEHDCGNLDPTELAPHLNVLANALNAYGLLCIGLPQDPEGLPCAFFFFNDARTAATWQPELVHNLLLAMAENIRDTAQQLQEAHIKRHTAPWN